MLSRFESFSINPSIYVYKNTSQAQAKVILQDKIPSNNEGVANGQKIWLLRESATAKGSVTFESIVYDKTQNIWQLNNPTRYMLSKNDGWVVNNKAFDSEEFNQKSELHGGMKSFYGLDDLEVLAIKVIDEKHCSLEQMVSPLNCKEQQVAARNRYTEEDESLSLPGAIADLLICPFAKEEEKFSALMKNPVVLKDDGRTYECDTLVARYKELGIELQQGVHYYKNIVLKNIIGYLAALEKSPQRASEFLEKIDEQEIIDTFSFDVFNTPMISPSGYSYSAKEIHAYISSKQVGLMSPVVSDPKNPEVRFGKAELIYNATLDAFIAQWPTFYKEMTSKIELN